METKHRVPQFGKKHVMLMAGVSVVALGGVMAPLQARAQANDTIETIVVTAEKRSESLQNVPLSIVAVTGPDLQNAGVSNAAQLQKIVPDLDIENISQAAGVTFRIRGFGSSSNAAIDPDVAPYVDTAYIGRPGAIVTSFLDEKSVEVLRGPQGTLFGRNAAMGAISITTNAPSTDGTTLDVMGQGGSYDTFAGQAIGNLPVTDDFAVRLAAGINSTDGFWHNLNDGKNYGGKTTPEGRLSAKWNVTKDITWTLHLDGASTTGDGYNPSAVDIGGDALNPIALTGFNTFATSAGRFTTCSAFVGAACTGTKGGATAGGTANVESANPSFTINQHMANPFLKDSQYGITSDLSWNLDADFMLRLVDSYRNWSDQQDDGDVVFTSYDLVNRLTTFSSRSQSHELQLVTPKGAFLDHTLGFTAGLYYAQEDYATNNFVGLGTDYCSHFWGTALLGKGLTFAQKAYYLNMAACTGGVIGDQTVGGYSLFNQSTDDTAGYFQVNYAILPNVELDLGARQTWDTKKGDYFSADNNAAATLFVNNNCLGAGCAPGTTAMKFQDSKPSWLGSLSWHVTDEVMAFGTFSTGYKSGGFNSAATTQSAYETAQARTFASEFVEDYELGLKSVWFDNKVLLNASLFSTQLHNFQDRSFSGGCNCFTIRNAGDVRSRGLETEGQIRAIDHFNINFSADYLDSIYESDLTAPQFDGCGTTLSAAGTQCATATQNLSGTQLPFAPKWQGNVGVEYNSDPFMGGFTATAALDDDLTSGYQSANNGSHQTMVAGYGVLNGRISLFTPDAKWQLDLFGSNLLNRHDIVAVFNQPGAALMGVNNTTTGLSAYRGYLGDPMTLGVRLSAKF
jgi:iron complex outermembrane recepter protein